MSIYDRTVAPRFVGRFVIGAVDHINGRGAEPTAFVVTKHELEQVARYWLKEQLKNAYNCFVDQQTGSEEWRTARYSADRLEAISEMLGAESLAAIEDDVTKAFQKTADPEAWRLFTAGTTAELMAFFERFSNLEEAFETNPFEVRLHLPEDERVRALVKWLCSGPVSGYPGETDFRNVYCRYATREEAEDLVQRMTTLRVPGLKIELVAR